MSVVKKRARKSRKMLASERLARRICDLSDKVQPLVPDIERGDLMLIIDSILRPIGKGRSFLMYEIRPGVYVV